MVEHAPGSERMATALTADPTLTLLGAYSRDWLLPLFAEHLEPVDDSVSAEWFHDRVAEALVEVKDEKDWQGDLTPAARCRTWVRNRWLDTEVVDGRTRYRLSTHALRALRFVRELVDGGSSVSGARLGSIAHAVRRLADMASPDRDAQVRRIDEEIEELRRRREEIATGRARLATPEQMQEQLREVFGMTRSLPADFRHLKGMVEERHRTIARRALSDVPKAELVEEYLHENDLLARTEEGEAYRRFARMLASSQESQTLRRDIDQILDSAFAGAHMTRVQRERLDGMFSTLLAAELQVEESYLRWTSSLRRILARAAHGRHARLLSASALALEAGAEWSRKDPGGRSREVDIDALGIGVLAVQDASQTQLWRDSGAREVSVSLARDRAELPVAERAALRLATGTGRRAVSRRIDRLVHERGQVTGAEVYAETPPEYHRLGTLVSLLDLAVHHGRVDPDTREQLALGGDRERELRVLLPHLVFDRPIGTVTEEG